ncbi:MAG: GntR family transcriptional regulator [Actinobacteria bacterium]|nr:GntR family transcriptional regulator [Actinomycetota bacterium]
MVQQTGNGGRQPRVRIERLELVRRRPLYEEAFLAIRTAILRGRFAPGERLYGPDIANELGLSRGPVREALHKLEQEGIVTSSPHLGSSVVTLDPAEIRDAMALREYLETLQCDALVAAVTDELLEELEQYVEQMRVAAEDGDAAALTEADYAFHDRLIGVGRSGLARRIWRSIAGQLQMALAVTDPVFVGENGDIVKEHAPILRALRRRDAAALEKALRRHLTNVGPLLQRAAAQRDEA